MFERKAMLTALRAKFAELEPHDPAGSIFRQMVTADSGFSNCGAAGRAFCSGYGICGQGGDIWEAMAAWYAGARDVLGLQFEGDAA